MVNQCIVGDLEQPGGEFGIRARLIGFKVGPGFQKYGMYQIFAGLLMLNLAEQEIMNLLGIKIVDLAESFTIPLLGRRYEVLHVALLHHYISIKVKIRYLL